MLSRTSFACALFGAALLAAAPVAALEFDQDVTPDAIFGGGNDNGFYTVDRQNGVELGLRGKLRFNAANRPENTFNSNGDGSYSFDAIVAPGGFSFCRPSPCPTTPIWSFEWSVNTDFDGSSGLFLADLTYEISLDGDPSCGVDALVFDPITPGIDADCWDHALGDNSTGNGLGIETGNYCRDTGSADLYADNVAVYNVAQNSWNYEFFNDAGTALEFFDPTVDGNYEITLTAFDSNGVVVAQTTMNLIAGAGGPCLAMDLRPSNTQNQVNTRANQLVPVAILGSETFDPCDLATGVEESVVVARGASPRTTRTSCEDANGDGFTDMVLYFRARDFEDPSEEECSDPNALLVLSGVLGDGTQFSAADAVTWLNCN